VLSGCGEKRKVLLIPLTYYIPTNYTGRCLEGERAKQWESAHKYGYVPNTNNNKPNYRHQTNIIMLIEPIFTTESVEIRAKTAISTDKERMIKKREMCSGFY